MRTLKVWGYDFDTADRVFVIRSNDTEKESFANSILNLMLLSNTTNPNTFFLENRVCILSTQEDFVTFLKSLDKRLDELQKNLDI